MSLPNTRNKKILRNRTKINKKKTDSTKYAGDEYFNSFTSAVKNMPITYIFSGKDKTKPVMDIVKRNPLIDDPLVEINVKRNYENNTSDLFTVVINEFAEPELEVKGSEEILGPCLSDLVEVNNIRKEKDAISYRFPKEDYDAVCGALTRKIADDIEDNLSDTEDAIKNIFREMISPLDANECRHPAMKTIKGKYALTKDSLSFYATFKFQDGTDYRFCEGKIVFGNYEPFFHRLTFVDYTNKDNVVVAPITELAGFKEKVGLFFRNFDPENSYTIPQ